VPPDAKIVVTFSQAMDRASTEAAFKVWNEGNPSIPGTFAWNDANTVLTFTPDDLLPFGDVFAIEVAETALAQSQQGGLREAWSSDFTVAPTPAIKSTTILPDAQGVDPEKRAARGLHRASERDAALRLPFASKGCSPRRR
jgi:hypothetical protein